MKDVNVLLVEDEEVLAAIIQESLQSRGFNMIHVATVEAAKQQHMNNRPDVMVLDVMLPDGSGFDLARQIRNIDRELPLIFLTSRSLPEDVVQGFESGGNDYLKKPFSMEELIVRIKALLGTNRLLTSAGHEKRTVQLGTYRFQYPKGELTNFNDTRLLTTRESEILHLLILNKNRILTRNDLLLTIWHTDDYFTGRSLDVFMAKLRKYLRDDPSVIILNIRGQGYKLVD